MGSWPNSCGRGFLSTCLHVTQLRVTDRTTLRLPMMWNRLDSNAVTSVGPVCRSLRCSLWISKTTKGCLPGRITRWRLAYISNDRFTLPPTHNIPFTFTNSQSGRSLLFGGNSLPSRNAFSSSEYSVGCTAANQRSLAARQFLRL